jgi:predicted HicB family RNase H-like nuclease
MHSHLSYRGYRGTINFSEELQCFFGKIDHISTLVCYEGDTRTALQEAFEAAVDDYLLNCARMGKRPERPFPRLAC